MARGLPAVLAVGLFIASALVPAALNASPAPARSESRPLLILEFNAPIPTDTVGRLEAAGAGPVCFLPPSSFLVRPGPGGAMPASLPDLVSISPLLPSDKTSADIPGYIEDGGRTVTALFAGPRNDLARSLADIGVRPLVWSPGSVDLGIDPSRIGLLASLDQIYWIEPALRPGPVLDQETRTLGVRQAADGAFLNDGASLWSYDNGAFEGTTGAGVNISITDSGIDGTHPAFDADQVAWQSYAFSTPWTDEGNGAGHGTMCAGIAAGNGKWRAGDTGGTDGKYVGMAPGAGLIGQGNIYDSYPFPTPYDLCKTANNLGAEISSNSWGFDGLYGEYIDECRDYDTYVRDADPTVDGNQPLIVVFSAGNSGPTSITVAPPSTAKNVISVGALGNDKSGPYGSVSSDTIIYYSSRGPTTDGRIKPDVCAPGVDVYTASALDNSFKGYLGTVPDDPDSSSYFVGGGTSAACPGVAGACALVVGYWRDKHGETPSPALTKALLINGAEPLPSYTYPGPDQGWGRINVSRSVISKDDRNIITVDQTVPLSTGDSSSILLNVSQSSGLKISLVWTDEPGSPSASQALVNDLDLQVTDPAGNVYFGNNFAFGQSVPGGQADGVNNVEGFLLNSPRPGRYWVNVTGRDVPVGPQDYALVLSGPIKQISADPVAEYASASPASPLEGDVVHLYFGVSDRGLGAASGYPYTISVDGQPVSNGTLPDLAPGASAILTADWMAVRGTHTFALDIDPMGILDEISESNNHAGTSTTVLHFGVAADLSPASIALDPGAGATAVAHVTNEGTARDTVLLSATTDTPGWTVSVSDSSLTLAPGAVAREIVNITCPPMALAHEKAVVKLRAVSQGNSTYSEAPTLEASANQVFGLSLSQPPPAAEVYPWETAEFNVTLTNGGNGEDIIGLSAQGPPEDWQFDLTNYTMVLPARSGGVFQAMVKPPDRCLAGNASVTNVTARSEGNVSAATALTVTVRQFYNISVDFLLLQGSAPPGGTVEAIYFINNLGNGPDQVGLALAEEPGWTARLNSSVLLPGYGLKPGNMTLTVPSDALTGDYAASFIARSFGGQTEMANFTIHVEQVFAVSASPQPRREVIFPGEPVNLSISVTNLGNGNDSFSVLPEGLPDSFSVSGIGGPVPLGARDSAATSVRLGSSRYTTPGNQTLTFRAVSRKSQVAINYTSISLVVLSIPTLPGARGNNIPFGPNPTVGGSEPCGVVLILAAVASSAIVIRSWRRRAMEYEFQRFRTGE